MCVFCLRESRGPTHGRLAVASAPITQTKPPPSGSGTHTAMMPRTLLLLLLLLLLLDCHQLQIMNQIMHWRHTFQDVCRMAPHKQGLV